MQLDELFSVQFIFMWTGRKANFTIEPQKCEGHKKCDWILISNGDFNLQISPQKKKLPMIQFFQIGLILSKKQSIVNCSQNSKSLKPYTFWFFAFWFKYKSVFVSYSLRSWPFPTECWRCFFFSWPNNWFFKETKNWNSHCSKKCASFPKNCGSTSVFKWICFQGFQAE